MTPAAIHVLLWGAATVALIHTVIGVDHYLPFIVIGKARKQTLRQVLGLTALCGLGHVLSSMVLGLVGIGLGVAVDTLEVIEGTRGSLAAWGLIAFGLVYAAWSAIRTARGHRHEHVHAHYDGTIHNHDHQHQGGHLHNHEARKAETDAKATQLSRWTLFVLFVFGPCEALIPMFMAPAWQHDWATVMAVAVVFSAVTVVTMLLMVTLGMLGLRRLALGGLARHANTLAGLAIAGSGLAIQLLGI